MKRIVVTGGSGVLGAALARRLTIEGHTVHTVDLRPLPPDATAHRHTVGDIRDPSVMRAAADGADAVVHSASALPSWRADEIRSVIVDGTRSMLDASVDVPRVVHVSSTAVYGVPDDVDTTEDCAPAPTDPYSAAKVEAERLCEVARADGRCVPILRPKTFLGTGRLGLFAMLFEWAEEGRHFPVLGRGDVRMQMCDAEDVVDAVLAVMTVPPDVANDAFNIAAAEFGTLREDFQAVLDAAGHGRRVVSLPIGPAYTVLSLLDRAHLSPVYGRLLRKLRADSYVSIERARDRLGFTPKFSNRDAILRSYDWWRAEHAAGRLGGTGKTSRDAWKQGALSLAKAMF